MSRANLELSAIYAIDKPCAMTSHDVVSRLRRITGLKRVGHAGTLDPAASGLLILGVGPATRLLGYLTAHDKSYLAKITFGAETDTCDSQGEITARLAAPERIADSAFAAQALGSLVGRRMQTPPSYSAKRVGGRRSYDLARAGRQVELEPVPIEVYSAELVATEPAQGDPGKLRPAPQDGLGAASDCGLPSWTVRLRVSAGTYIRSIARDLGRELGTYAHLGALRRLSCGSVSVSQAASLEGLSMRGLDAALLDPALALGLPVVELSKREVEACVDGKRIPRAGLEEGALYSLVCAGRLYALHTACGAELVAKTVIPGGVEGVSVSEACDA